MRRNTRTTASIWVLLIFFSSLREGNAQDGTHGPVDIEVRISPVNRQVVSHILKISNPSGDTFIGHVRISPPPEIQSLSQDERAVALAPGDSVFVAYRLLVGRDVTAGRKTVAYNLYNGKDERVAGREAFIDIEEREQVDLLPDDMPVTVVRPEDSVRVQVTVINHGNTREEVAIVFNVPGMRGGAPFTELVAVLRPMEQKRFTYSFIPDANLFAREQYTVQVTAMKGKEKTIFGSRSVIVRNLLSNRRYVDVHPNPVLYPGQGSDGNSVTLSYRRYGSSSDMMQLQGAGSMNLPAGYLRLQGNLYAYGRGGAPMITNTSLSYRLYGNEFTVGNVSEQTELSLYGRGAKAVLSDKTKGKTLTFGAIDQHFNLIGPQPWFSDYYSFYVQGALGENNTHKGVKAIYIYRKNPYESAKYNVGGLQWRTLLRKNWEIRLGAYGSLCNYWIVGDNRFSGAVDFSYKGNLPSGTSLNGNSYYSDGYFPGNRRGTLSLTRGVSRKLPGNLRAGGQIGYNRMAPKSYGRDDAWRSENSFANLFVSLPRLHRVSSSLYYHHQGESSLLRAFGIFGNDGEAVTGNARMASHRVGGQWRWQSPDARHSLFGALEGGFFAGPPGSRPTGQVKTTLNYSAGWLTAYLSYQNGAYHLYEYMTAPDKKFYRFSASASVNGNVSKKLSFSSNINFTRDACQGSLPSANLSGNFSAKGNMAFFINASYYRYRFGNTGNLFNMQVGVTWNFGKAQPLSGRKSKVVGRVYYDRNGNGRFDEEDEPADNYPLQIGNKAFISDKEGKVRYSLVPYGELDVTPVQPGSWSFDRIKVDVDSRRTSVDIPLKQSGILHGSVRYISDGNSVAVMHRYEGLRLLITDTDGAVLQTVVTGAGGTFTTFLPTGTYTVTLDIKTLPDRTECRDHTRTFTIEGGKTATIDPFEIEVKGRKVNMKRFFDSDSGI